MICIPKERTGYVQHFLVQVLDRRLPRIFGKGMGHIVFIHMCQICHGIQSDMICIICIQVFLDLCTFFCHVSGRHGHRNKMLGTDDPEDQDLQKILTDFIRTVGLAPYLIQDLGTQTRNQIMIGKIAEKLNP